MTIKAIETRYRGYRFRSRLEARWAVFFDALGVKWEYEKEGFNLDGLCYLPDFWLPERRIWVEIKDGSLLASDAWVKSEPCPEARESIDLATSLCNHSQDSVAIFWGLPEPVNDLLGWIPNLTHLAFFPIDTEMVRHFREDPDEYGGTKRIDKYERFGGSASSSAGGFGYEELLGVAVQERHIAMARSARFEHGETPNV